VSAFEAIQCRALLGVLKPDQDAWLRHVLRTYSKVFHTPLHVVQDLPPEDVLLAYYEEAFEQMDEEAREEFLERLTETEAQRKERESQEEKQEKNGDSFFDSLNAQIAADMKQGRPQPKGARKKKEKLPGRLSAFDPEKLQPPTPEPDEPVVEMTFDSGKNSGSNLPLEDLMARDPLGASRRSGPRKG